MEAIRYSEHIKATLKLGTPIIIGQLGIIILGFADTLMVGRYSTDALAAASFVNNIFTLITILLMGFSYGITPLISSLFSRKEYERVGAELKNALLANSIYCTLLVIAMLIFYAFIDKMGQPEHLLPLIKPYYLIILVSMFFVMLFNIMRQFTDGIMRTPIAMWILITGNFINIIFNYFLIYGVGFFPEMGLVGAGISTLFSRILMVVIYAWLFWYGKSLLPYRDGFLKNKINRNGVKSITKLSFPVSLQMGMETATFTVSAIMIGWIGAVEMASYQVMVTIGTLGYMFYYGFGAAIAIRIASYLGVNDIVNLKRAASSGYKVLLGLVVLASAVIFFFSEPLISIFTNDEAVRITCGTLIIPLILYQLGDATQVGYANALRGTSKVMSMMWIALISFVLVGIPTAYTLGFVVDMGVVGIFLSFSVALFTAGALFYIQFRKAVKALEP